MYISFKHKQYTVSTDNTPIMISFDSNEIHPSTEERLLGVTISNTLCWNKHSDHVLKTCNSYLYRLTRMRSIYLCKTEYYFIIHTFYLIYNTAVLSRVVVIQYQEDKLVQFQNRATRIILDKDYKTPST